MIKLVLVLCEKWEFKWGGNVTGMWSKRSLSASADKGAGKVTKATQKAAKK